MNRFARPDLTLAQQFLFLRSNPICKGQGKLTANSLTWNYPVRPTPLSREYHVRVTLDRRAPPKTVVLEPDLELLAGDRRLPHVYRDPLQLCLYFPKEREWTGSMRLDKSVVPWAAAWLFYFEEWLASDSWKGGGVHPTDSD